MTLKSKAFKYRYKFWNAIYKYAQGKRWKMLDQKFTTVPPGVDIKREHKGIVEDPPGTPTPVMPIIPIEVEIRKPDHEPRIWEQ